MITRELTDVTGRVLAVAMVPEAADVEDVLVGGQAPSCFGSLGRVTAVSGRGCSMSRFSKGQKVRALASVQGLEAGAEYVFVEVLERYTPFGNFVTYGLRPVGAPDNWGEVIYVLNGHLEEVA